MREQSTVSRTKISLSNVLCVCVCYCCFARWPLVGISDRNRWSVRAFIGNFSRTLFSSQRWDVQQRMVVWCWWMDGCWVSTDASIKLLNDAQLLGAFIIFPFELSSTNAHDTQHPFIILHWTMCCIRVLCSEQQSSLITLHIVPKFAFYLRYLSRFHFDDR